MDTIFQRTNRAPEFGFTNVLQIMLENAISKHLFFARGLFLEIEIRITFLYEKKFQQMIPFSKELTELYNSASARLYKLSAQIKFFQSRVSSERTFLEILN